MMDQLPRFGHKSWFARFLILSLAATITPEGIAFAAKKEAPTDPGPQPTWQRFKELSESALTANLFDPGSATIEWPNGYTGGWWKPGPFMSRVDGWFTCGIINAKNRMGGYVGRRPFVVVIRDDRVVYQEIGEDASKTFDLVQINCRSASDKGILPPVAAMATLPPGKPAYGFSYDDARSGIQIARVAAGSPAESAGIRAGTIIASVNGIPLQGLSGESRIQILSAAEGEVVLRSDGGTEFRVRKIPPEDFGSASEPVRSLTLGFTAAIAKDFATVLGVDADGAAQRAGLNTGMKISRINGIPLSGLSRETLTQIVGSVSGKTTLVVEGHGSLELSP